MRLLYAPGSSKMIKLSIRRLWTTYADIMFQDNARSGMTFSRTLAHASFYAGARSTLKVLAYMLEHGEHRAAAPHYREAGAEDQSDPRMRATQAPALTRSSRTNQRLTN